MPRRRRAVAVLLLLVGGLVGVAPAAEGRVVADSVRVAVRPAHSTPEGDAVTVLAIVRPRSSAGTVTIQVDGRDVAHLVHLGGTTTTWTTTTLTTGRHRIRAVFDPSTRGRPTVRSAYALHAVSAGPVTGPGDHQTVRVVVPPHAVSVKGLKDSRSPHPSTKPSVLGTGVNRDPRGTLPFTGFDVIAMLVLGGLLCLLGLALVRASRPGTRAAARLACWAFAVGGLLLAAAELTTVGDADDAPQTAEPVSAPSPAPLSTQGIWPGATPTISVSEAGVEVTEGTVVHPGVVLHLTATGFDPRETIRVGASAVRADGLGTVSYDYSPAGGSRGPTDLVLRGRRLVTAWHLVVD